MEKVQAVIRKYEDIISTCIQLVICLAAVIIALKTDRSADRKQKEKLAKTRAKLQQKTMKTEAKLKQKSLKTAARNELKLQKAKARQRQAAAIRAK